MTDNNNDDDDHTYKCNDASEATTTTRAATTSSSNSTTNLTTTVAALDENRNTAAVPLPLILVTLPRESLAIVHSYLTLEELHEFVRPTCRQMRDVVDADRRWMPIIAPPRLSKQVLRLDLHGEYLRRLYFQQKRWFDDWEDKAFGPDEDLLRQRQSALDGFFSLSPWLHQQHCDLPSYPTPWLHRMVYGDECPTLLAMTGVTGSPCPPKKKKQRRDSSNPDERLSTFFQRRVRPEEDTFRTFITDPIDSVYFRIIDPCRPKIIIQPVNFRNSMKDGAKRDELPDHNMEDLDIWNPACASIMECFFGKGRVKVAPLVHHMADLSARWKGMCRKDLQGRTDEQGRRVLQVNAQALVGLSDYVLENCNTSKEDKNLVIFIIRPHMFDSSPWSREFAWMISTSLEDGKQRPCPWVVSTFQLYNEILDKKKRIHLYVKNVLYTALLQLDRFRVCENSRCVMNNVDSMTETGDAPLITCPACTRKLQLEGQLEVGKIPEFLTQLHCILSSEPLASVCQEDVQKLEEWGAKSKE